MSRHIRFILLALLPVLAAVAQTPAAQNQSTSIFDTVSRWLTVVGEKTEDLLSPKFGRIGDAGKSVWAGLTTRTREYEQSYQVRPTCIVNIARLVGEGEVRVSTWDNPIVRVQLTAAVGAEQGETAQQLVDAVKLLVTPTAERVDVGAEAPDTRDKGKVAIKLDCEITMPAGASLMCRNEWGDTTIDGVNGNVTVDSKFGALEMKNIGGAVRVRSWGEFPLRAYALRQGGEFELQGTQAEFANVSGALKVSNFMGSVAVRELPAETELDVTSESGPIQLYLPENATPEISASTVFGSISSEYKLETDTRGDLVTARGGSLGAKQRLSLHATFDSITIHQEGVKPPAQAPAPSAGELVRRNQEQSVEVPAGADIVVKAIAGNLKITAADTNQVQIKASQVVQLRSNANAQAAIEALSLRSEVIDGRVMITTSVRDNMEALGCTRYSVDLELVCPRNSSVKVSADSGFTSVSEMGAAVAVEQGKGRVTVERCNRASGNLDVTLQAGDVSVTDSTGPLTVVAQQGAVETVGISGKQVITAQQGRVKVDSPKGDLELVSHGGDVTVLALEGVLGEYKVGADKGNVNVVLGDASDATLWVTAKNGQVSSKVLLNGSIEREQRVFNGKIGAGQHKVELTVDTGNIFID